MGKTTLPVAIRFRDTDAMGHVNNAVYLSYFELARMHYFDQHMQGRWDWTQDGIILARNEVDYMQPVFLLDDIYIESSVVRVGNTSFTMQYELYKKTEGGVSCCARCLATLVCFNFETNSKYPVPEAWRAFMEC